MTKHESFKRRVRARMASTGERYEAARRVLVEQASRRRRTWHAEPQVGDETVRGATGKDWEEWCAAIEAWPGNAEGHGPIARHLETEHGIEPWWAQTVTVGFERITGRRLPYQQPDGSFTASKSRTVPVAPDDLRLLLLDPDDRADLLGGELTVLRSRPTSKVVRIQIGPGVAQISLDAAADGRTKVTVAHEKLPTIDEVERWRAYWTDWLEALAGA